MTAVELGRRAVDCKRWRWMPGMAVLGGFAGADRLFADKWGMIHAPDEDAGMLPDLSDPATLGCLLHLVREAWGEQIEVFAYRTEMHDKRWCIERAGSERDPSLAWYGWTEAEALVAALEAAP